MWAVRKVSAAPGAALRRGTFPHFGDDECSSSRGGPSVCGSLTLQTSSTGTRWAAKRDQACRVTLGSTSSRASVRRLSAAACGTSSRRYVSADKSMLLAARVTTAARSRAHVANSTQILGVDRDGAFAQYRRRARVGDLEERPREAPPEIATLGRSRSATPSSRSSRRTSRQDGRRPRLRPDRFVSRSGIRTRLRAARVLASDRMPFRLDPRPKMGAHDVLDVTTVADVPTWFAEHNEGEHPDVVFESPCRRRRSSTRSASCATAAARHPFWNPALPRLDVADLLIFKNSPSPLSTAVRSSALYKTRWLLEHGRRRSPPLVTPSSVSPIRARICAARVGGKPARSCCGRAGRQPSRSS